MRTSFVVFPAVSLALSVAALVVAGVPNPSFDPTKPVPWSASHEQGDAADVHESGAPAPLSGLADARAGRSLT